MASAEAKSSLSLHGEAFGDSARAAGEKIFVLPATKSDNNEEIPPQNTVEGFVELSDEEDFPF